MRLNLTCTTNNVNNHLLIRLSTVANPICACCLTSVYQHESSCPHYSHSTQGMVPNYPANVLEPDSVKDLIKDTKGVSSTLVAKL